MNGKTWATRLLIALSAASVTACSDDATRSEAPIVTAVDIESAQSATPEIDALSDLQATDAEPDLARGEQLWRQCAACHRIGPGAANASGPHLNALFGRQAGGLAGFPYSNALREADFVWTPRALDAWLRSPYRFLPGNRMSFGGISRPDDRHALIAWLLSQTDTDG